MATAAFQSHPVPAPPPGLGPSGLGARAPGAPSVRRLGRAIAAATQRRGHSAFYSRLVIWLRVVLPALAVALAGLVLLWPRLNPIDQRFRITPVQVGIDDLENLRMLSPRLLGLDDRNQPYTIIAEQATQASAVAETTELAKPNGDIAISDGSWIALSAATGFYNKSAQTLDLVGDVNLFQDGGYEIHTAKARIFLGPGNAEGDAPVVGQGPGAELQGQGFLVHNRGERITVTGQSRLLLLPAQPLPGAQPARQQR